MQDRHREVHEAFRWDVPPDFNIAHWACRRWAGERYRLAVQWEDESGARDSLSYWDLAQRAKQVGVNAVVFDRGGYRYHGRVAAWADGAREGGLEF